MNFLRVWNRKRFGDIAKALDLSGGFCAKRKSLKTYYAVTHPVELRRFLFAFQMNFNDNNGQKRLLNKRLRRLCAVLIYYPIRIIHICRFLRAHKIFQTLLFMCCVTLDGANVISQVRHCYLMLLIVKQLFARYRHYAASINHLRVEHCLC